MKSAVRQAWVQYPNANHGAGIFTNIYPNKITQLQVHIPAPWSIWGITYYVSRQFFVYCSVLIFVPLESCNNKLWSVGIIINLEIGRFSDGFPYSTNYIIMIYIYIYIYVWNLYRHCDIHIDIYTYAHVQIQTSGYTHIHTYKSYTHVHIRIQYAPPIMSVGLQTLLIIGTRIS